MRSLGLYQDHSSPKGDGHQANYIHRRHTDNGGVGGSVEGSSYRHHLPPRASRVRSKLPQVSTGAKQELEITGGTRHLER